MPFKPTGFPNNQVKAARLAVGIPQYKLATRSGVTQPHISQIESGIKNPTWLTLQKLALALNCSPHDLIVPDISPDPGCNAAQPVAAVEGGRRAA